jgi:hypothetical protein
MNLMEDIIEGFANKLDDISATVSSGKSDRHEITMRASKSATVSSVRSDLYDIIITNETIIG